MSASDRMPSSLRRIASAVTKGLFEITHNSFALLGLAVLFATMTLVARPELRQLGETRLFTWLQERQADVGGLVSNLVSKTGVTAADPKELPKQQAAVAFWLSKKYRVAPEPISALVAEAYDVGAQTRLDPTLILAVMAIESGFNPYAQSAVGAQGLMQVMTNIHSDKYKIFGGKLAAFDPLANLRVGVKVLQDCIQTAGSIEGGLKSYVGASNQEDDGGYAAKVLAEHARLQLVAKGQSVPVSTPSGSNPATTAKNSDALPGQKSTPPKVSTLALN